MGSKVTLTLQALPGLNPLPTLTIVALDQNNKGVTALKDVTMDPNADDPNQYQYTLEVKSPSFIPGKVVTATATVTGIFKYKLQPGVKDVTATATFQFVPESATLSDIAGAVASLSTIKADMSDLASLIRSGSQSSGDEYQLLQRLERQITELPRTIAKEVANQGAMYEIRSTLNQVAQQIKVLAGEQHGYDLSKIIGKALDESSSLKDIRGKADRVQGTTELMMKIMDQNFRGIDAPVIHAVFE
jgi:hypothetical protein